ncbi:hypothetical protein [Novosphingobium sp. 32-60-15]|uniref:hypothetical protein n=1 Tax=Novosphingobium sp. 32-60-15 TaxID=1970410 RepID=UPI0025ECBDBB|nr:hypothetical protein [Novosphingobium sp. 32-60-15]
MRWRMVILLTDFSTSGLIELVRDLIEFADRDYIREVQAQAIATSDTLPRNAW